MKRGRLLYVWLPTLIIVVGALGYSIGAKKMARKMRDEAIVSLAQKVLQNKLSYTIELIKHAYVDSVNVDSLADLMLPDLIAELDPHSAYIPAELMQKVNEPLNGEFEGVGIVFNMATDTVIILNVVPRGPSQKAGIQAGDRIVKIGERNIAGQQIPSDSIMLLLRGKRGTEVDIAVQRDGIGELIPFTITRDKIPIKSVDAAFMIAPDVAFIRLSTFARTTYSEFVMSMDTLLKQGMKSLILDLRGNMGGYFEQSFAIANEFLPKNKLIVYTQYRDGSQNKIFSDGRGRYPTLPVSILIDEETASSSEIVAGALQDNDRATIIGRRSFGKGLVQQPFPYSDGSELRLTIARYYTPTGRSIQKPYTLGHSDEYEEEILKRYTSDQIFKVDSSAFVTSEKFTTPEGKIVYGGGGIMPDVFVGVDTIGYTTYYRQVMGRNILYRFTLDWVDAHRKEINALRSIGQLERLLDSDRNMMQNFIDYAARNGVPVNRAEIARSEKLMRAIIRAYIGRNTPLEDVGFYANYYVIDETIMKALILF